MIYFLLRATNPKYSSAYPASLSVIPPISPPSATTFLARKWFHVTQHRHNIFHIEAYQEKTIFTSHVSVQLQKKSDAMKVKDFLGMFCALDSSWHSQKFSKTITEIRLYSLLDFDSENETYPIHPLVQAWALPR